MVKCYISLSLDNGEITSISNIKDGSCTIEAELVDPMFDFSKLIGYKFDGKTLSFDQNKWNAHVAEQNHQEAIKNGEAMLDKLAEQSILENADDATAYAMRYLYPEWNPEGVNYFKDKWPNRVIFEDKFYKVEQDHISQESWTPEEAPSLFTEISDPNEEWPEFKQPTHAENAYMKDDKITYNGKHYQSNIDNNVWSSDDYPAGWRLVEEGE